MEGIFAEDVVEKKKCLSGVRGKTGKRGYIGKVLFPSDFLSRREKYRYRKAGKVVTYNMYDTIMSYKEFLQLNEEDQRKTLIEYRKRFSNAEIMKAFGIGHNTLYRLVEKLNIPKKSTRLRKINQTVVQKQAEVVTSVEVVQAPRYKVDGLNISFNGQYTPEEIIKRLEKIALLLDGEKSNFQIEFSIKELAK